jgi:hypothetical protein
MGDVYVFALTAALNPTLLAAVTLMLTLERPKRLLLGYWLGAILTTVTWGLVLVFAVSGSNTASTAKHTISPAIDITLGALILVMAFVVATGRDRRRQARIERRREKAADKPPPRWKRALSKGSARDTFVIGILLSFPGASFIAGMDELAKQKISTAATVLAVISFCLIELLILELPLIGYMLKPESTEEAVKRFSDWLSRRGGRVALIGAFVIGALLIIRGIANLS